MSGHRVYIGNIPHDSRESDLEKFFKGYGKIREVVLKIAFDVDQRSYAFVEFEESRDAKDATYDLNKKDMRGKK